jgi:hypothetical protein
MAKPLQYEEVEVPQVIQDGIADGFSVRMFKVPSKSRPGKFHYVQVVKTAKAGWGNGTPIFLCNCERAQFQQALAIMGDKATCDHSKLLREALRS